MSLTGTIPTEIALPPKGRPIMLYACEIENGKAAWKKPTLAELRFAIAAIEADPENHADLIEAEEEETDQ